MPYKEAKAALLDRFERAYVTALLERHDHNTTAAAAAAGISRKHLHELSRKVGEAAADDDAPDDAPL
jgi:DNA-binding NtrC family response regulator